MFAFMNNLLEIIFNTMTTDHNVSQIGNKTLFCVNMLLFAVIPSLTGIGTIEDLNINIASFIEYSIKGAYSFAFSVACKWLWNESIKKYRAWKRKKNY